MRAASNVKYKQFTGGLVEALRVLRNHTAVIQYMCNFDAQKGSRLTETEGDLVKG